MPELLKDIATLLALMQRDLNETRLILVELQQMKDILQDMNHQLVARQVNIMK